MTNIQQSDNEIDWVEITNLSKPIKVDAYSVYCCKLSIENIELYGSIKLLGKDKEGNIFAKRIVQNNGEIRVIFFSNENPIDIFFTFNSKKIKGLDQKLILKTFNIAKVGDTKKTVTLTTNEYTVSAAIATYPARKKSFLECIESLIDQVDNLLIYLNEYSEIPAEIKNHPLRKKIICIIDEEGGRRAGGKFHWMNRVNGYYLTCDDDIIYPPDYVSKTVNSIDAYHKKYVVGYHGITFNGLVANFTADRKSFYKFTEELTDNQQCHLIGTGVAGFHTTLFKNINIQLFDEYPFAVDPALSVICKRNKIPMICLSHKANWLKSSPYMLYGLHEEKQIFKEKKKSVNQLLQKNNPWSNDFYEAFIAIIKRNPKVRKLINNPKQFFKDAQILGFYR